MSKIQMKTPLVEIDGDEMTRVVWAMLKEKLIHPFIDLKTEYYDLDLLKRNDSDDRITVDAAEATKRLGVAVKCATITPNRQRLEEFPELKEMWRSPNGTIRAILDGTVFRTPVIVKNIKPVVKGWDAPITVARHAYGDIYKVADMRTTEPGTATLRFVGESGAVREMNVENMTGPGVILGMHNTEKSISSFAQACFNYAMYTKQNVWFGTKDTISKVYDSEFKIIFEREFETYKDDFEKTGIEYMYSLIDDVISRVMRSRGGFIWACKNYDGDVMSDMIASAFGSLGMMSSVLVSPDGNYEFEAAHGTVTRHYRRHLKGEQTSTNPVATIFAWSGALRRRGELDGIPELMDFSDRLENVTRSIIEGGDMTGDIAILAEGETRVRTSAELMDMIAERL